MKTEITVMMFAFVLISSTTTVGLSYGASEEQEYAVVSGYLNVREVFYVDGTISHDFLVMTDDNSTYARYLLELDAEQEQELILNIENLAGSTVLVEGILEGGGTQIGAASVANSENSEVNAEAIIQVKSIGFGNRDPAGSPPEKGSVEIMVNDQSHLITRTLEQVVAPARYADIEASPHPQEYYESQFFADENYSLAAYWRDASYGNLVVDGFVTQWVDLPQNEDYYFEFGGREDDLVAEIDSQIDFDGPDNTIENISPNEVLESSEGDDVDSIIGIYNGLIGPGIAGYGYINPIQVSTDEGTLYAYFIAISDTGLGSPAGVPSDYFVGLAAHEMGHNFGWYHTATPDCVFCDPWSIMSGGIYSDLGPSGPIATHRESEGWIEADDILTITDDQQERQVVEFTLDMLGRPNGENDLMAKVHFGSNSHYYTIEARKNVVNDHTPLEQTGLVVYHYSPTGHVNSMEPLAFETIVDTTGIGDLANADIDPGDSFVDAKNNITITNLAENDDTIVVKVMLGDGLPENRNVYCNGMNVTVVGTLGPDILEGTSGDDIIHGLSGNDVIYGLGGNDIICGGMGADTIEGGDGDDVLLGNPGSDILLGNDGNDYSIGGIGADKLDGGDGNDELFGWSDNDELLGGNGHDFLYGGRGDDYLLGGEGYDRLWGWLGNDTYADQNDPQ